LLCNRALWIYRATPAGRLEDFAFKGRVVQHRAMQHRVDLLDHRELGAAPDRLRDGVAAIELPNDFSEQILRLDLPRI
jgi:hypothetical protein